ncbi:hypothetical protein P4O66_002872 [Electrophorus voltai]|uniref:Rho-GAP domain-containing protein n=1 Tax=Electrophorus voltai TaxID=2609070 RepID=A0AAD8YVP8_9TELE|nr:hypothetical protein P4O66_002872 [Electrophorus voltai]
MPENKQAVQRTGSYLSHSAYRRIKRVLSFRRRVFGQRLEETVLYERRYGDHMAPLVVEQCVDFIRERGLLEVGLFRQPGQATLVKELQEAFDAGEKPSFDSSTDVHTVASLLKLYLRELPEPLVPFSRYQEFLMCGKKMPSDREQMWFKVVQVTKVEGPLVLPRVMKNYFWETFATYKTIVEGLLELKTLLHELPVANFNLLKYICQFLNEVQSYSSTNKMSIQNLATVFGPNILRPKAEDPESIIGGAAVVQHLMQHDQVEWVYTEPSAHPSEHQLRMGSDRLAQPAATSTSCLRKLSLPLTTERRPSRQSSRAQRHLSESQQWQPEASSPTSSCLLYENHSPSLSARAFPHTALVPPTTPPTASSSTTAVSDTRDGSRAPSRSWPAQGQSGWEAERAFRDSVGSSEAQESTLSVYDNMGPEGRVAGCAGDGQAHGGAGDLEGCAGSMADSSSSWSSCEILLTEGGNICKRAASPCHSPLYFPSFRSDPEEGDRHPDSPAPSSAPTDAPLSTGSSDVFLPNAPPDPAASQSMQCVLVGLRQQMARQKAEYESKINRLELQKEALQGQVSGLHTTLEQQRQWISMAEIKMRNVERARADADRRNATLQQEMEQFFHTFGELNSEARKTERIAQSF